LIDSDKIKEAIQYIASMEYGETLMHDEIAELVGETYGTHPYRSAVSKIYFECLKQGKMFKNVKGIGYRLVMPDDYAICAIGKIMKGSSQIKRGVDIMTYAPVDKMNLLERQRHREISDHMNRIDAHMRAGIVEANLLNKEIKQLTPGVASS